MKKRRISIGLASLIGVIALSSCSDKISEFTNANESNNTISQISLTDNTGKESTVFVDEDVNQGEFTIETEDGGFNVNNNIYTIYKGGTYSLSGLLNGQIQICVTEANSNNSYDVELELNGTTIKYDKDSPIYIMESSDSSISYDVSISAKKDTKNVVKDERGNKESDSDTTGSAAIYSLVDLKLKGKGELYVTGNYNNGIHSKDDISIKNLTLMVKAYNNAIKGNDSVEIESGAITLISTGGDGIKTTNTGLTSKGKQKGNVTISGGEVTIYACCDGIDAAYDVIIEEQADVTIYTDKYSSYTDSLAESTSLSSLTGNVVNFGFGPGGGNPGGGPGFNDGGNTDKSSHSAKGIKCDNSISITGGKAYIKAYDDGLHADNDTVMESTNSKGIGTINISGGEVTIYASDDGIHAENAINITDNAYINITYSHEGIEGNQITFDGGSCYVYSTDDAVNAAKGGVNTTPAVYIKNGYIDLDCASGDTDTVDSNGSVYISGGVTVLKNRQSQTTSMTGGTIDVDNSVSMTGGILLSFGTWCNEAKITASKTSSSSVASGTYYVKDSSGNVLATTSLAQSYSGYRLFNKTNGTYTLFKDTTSLTTF